MAIFKSVVVLRNYSQYITIMNTSILILWLNSIEENCYFNFADFPSEQTIYTLNIFFTEYPWKEGSNKFVKIKMHKFRLVRVLYSLFKFKRREP